MKHEQPIRIRKKYTRYTDGQVHPMVSGEIHWQSKSEPIMFLLDSGASYTMVHRRYAGLLGMNLVDTRPDFIKQIQGVFGRPVDVNYYHMKITVEGYEMKVPVGFSDMSWNLLGRCSAFSELSPIVLIEHEERFILECRGRKNVN